MSHIISTFKLETNIDKLYKPETKIKTYDNFFFC